jgi:metallo-beta-lactamase class B
VSVKSRILSFVAVLSFAYATFGQRDSTERAEWNQPVEPFRIIGNIYYVGVTGVASYLIATPKGHVLLDGGFAESALIIEKNIASLNFRVQDVKYLLNSHAHYDHCGGLATLKRASGAQMVATRADAEVLESGRQKNYSIPDSLFPRVKVDRLIGDGETVELGGATLTAVLTPGHTKGCTTWTMRAQELGKTYEVVFYCSTSVPGYPLVDNPRYPEIVSDYEQSFTRLRLLPCDVFLAPHGSFFHLMEKRAEMTKGGANPFVDSSELRSWVDQSEQEFQQELKAQQAAKAGK